jgi:hypothetical protein
MGSRVLVCAVLIVAVTGCGPQEESNGLDVLVSPSSSVTSSVRPTAGPSDPESTADDEDPFAWRPTYRDVRPADDAELAALRERVTVLATSEWTASDDLLGLEMAWTPTHVRVLIPGGEVHLDPRKVDDQDMSYVLCVEEEGCVRIGPDAKSDGPHLTNNYLDSMTFAVFGLVYNQSSLDVFAKHGPTVLATVDSPVGPLDCVVHGSTKQLLADLEGQPTDPDPGGAQRADKAVYPTCVDSHGLVAAVQLQIMFPARAWPSWSAGVADDVTQYPAEVEEYNELQ